MHTPHRVRARSSRSRFVWIAAAMTFVGGCALWLLGVSWSVALPGLALIGFVVATWLDVRPQGGHVHDTGLSAYGVSEAPQITSDR